MNSMNGILLIIFFFGASALFSGLETGGYLLNRLRLRLRVRQGSRAARRLQIVLGDAHRFIFTVLIANNVVNYLLSREVTRLYLRAGVGAREDLLFGFLPWNAETAATLTLMFPVFFFAELLPKNVFRRRADRLMYHYSGILALTDRLLRPATALLKTLFRLLTGGRGRTEALSAFTVSLQGFREYFTEDAQRGALSDHQHGMIDNLVAMHRVLVRDVMQPIGSFGAVPETAVVRQALDLMRARDTEQIAVYRGSVHRLTGLVTLFDLMDPGVQPSDTVKSRVHNVVRLDEDLSLTCAFRRLRQKKEPIAIITDRSSRAVGLLHLRDVARYIVSGG